MPGSEASAPPPLPVVALRGDARARGHAHGETLRDQIHEILGPWERGIARATGRPLQETAARFRGETKLAQAMQRYAPGLLDEIDAVAQAAGVDPAVLFLFNCPDESEWYLDHIGRGLALPEGRGCSSLAVPGTTGSGPIAGQNFDIPTATDGFQVLFHLQPEGPAPEAYVFSIAGIVGMIGLSRAPVGVLNNALRILQPRQDGLPVNAMVRALLACPSYEAAVRFLREAPHASGHNWVLAGPDTASMWEGSARQIVEVTRETAGAGSARGVVHTNHPLRNDDLQPGAALPSEPSSTSCRLASLARDVLAAPAPLAVADVMRALGAHRDGVHPVCRHQSEPLTNFTAVSVVYETSPEPTLHLAPGPPCETPFARFRFGTSDSV